MISSRLLALLALVVIGCGSQATSASVAPTAAPTVAAEPSPHASGSAPLSVEWIVGHVSASGATLIARVERFVPFAVPLDVEIRLPPGAQLVPQHSSALSISPGLRATMDLLPNASARVDEIQVDLAYDTIPADDLVIVIDAQRPGGGVHAQVPYRFGRPEPMGPMPQPTGQHVVVGGRDFGGAVPAQ